MRAALEALPGVRRVNVDFERKQAEVIISREGPNEEAMKRALAEAGYEGSYVETMGF